MNPLKFNKLVIMAVVIFAVAAVFSGVSFAQDSPVTLRFDNGISVNLYSPGYILETMVRPDEYGRYVFYPPGHAGYSLITDIMDPAVVNKGDGEFHPMREEAILSAIEDIKMRGVSIPVEVDLFVLPLPRRYIPTSSSSGMMIFLSPGVIEVSAEVTAFTVTHEIGHSVQNRFMPDLDERAWDRYLSLRGILDDPEYTDDSVHMNRPREIFAEDFRYLFGSETANLSGTIENSELKLPDEVRGLDRFFLTLISSDLASSGESAVPGRIVSASNYPNPFNPATVINTRFENLSEELKVDIRIYDVNGRLIRNLFNGTVTGSELSVPWDGKGDNGAKTGSGIYFYSIRSGIDLMTGKMLLIR
ncbi:MAG: T9SS type A sorting domain-containing protein [Candidatus Krumholzibacteriota bacterium]|nr:T9SS type A sorting domain-containing protein [Candidatus Krumholzibacteriota bacterium]